MTRQDTDLVKKFLAVTVLTWVGWVSVSLNQHDTRLTKLEDRVKPVVGKVDLKKDSHPAESLASPRFPIPERNVSNTEENSHAKTP